MRRRDLIATITGVATWPMGARAQQPPAIDPQGAANLTLPLWDTICLSYSTYTYNFQDVLRISWLWLVVVVVAPDDIPNWLQFVFTLAGVSIAVAWHRYIILGEYPRFSGSNVGTKNFWRYVGAIVIAIYQIVILPGLAVGLPMSRLLAGTATGEMLVNCLIYAYLVAVFFAVAGRLSLLLPARAVGDLGLSFIDAWNATRGNTWRIFWGIAACTMLPMLLAAPIQIALVGFPTLPGMFASEAFVGRMTVSSTIVVAYYLLILPIGIGLLSHSYQYFFKRT
jgi:hypothetical protein